jgi:hypothetical protein
VASAILVRSRRVERKLNPDRATRRLVFVFIRCSASATSKSRVFRFKGSTTNLAYNALDKQIELGRGNQVAMFAERNNVGEAAAHQPDSYTYSELRDEV